MRFTALSFGLTASTMLLFTSTTMASPIHGVEDLSLPDGSSGVTGGAVEGVVGSDSIVNDGISKITQVTDGGIGDTLGGLGDHTLVSGALDHSPIDAGREIASHIVSDSPLKRRGLIKMLQRRVNTQITTESIMTPAAGAVKAADAAAKKATEAVGVAPGGEDEEEEDEEEPDEEEADEPGLKRRSDEEDEDEEDEDEGGSGKSKKVAKRATAADKTSSNVGHDEEEEDEEEADEEEADEEEVDEEEADEPGDAAPAKHP
ncbi:uncharacterized protein BX663DRAFT_551682 [Cokeromyces recurvatus]|uniref:uncharacterized protein n=1 Tax=Cokeromyces recurvatus TaxID=90255 RepID=UPI00221F7BD9|nr:uncharacterized protein BX663DRAFT_551682 [Cokeromyces recurvatus]KAI7903411.1 hypothetical protein BX663DRAFT_551682 [Cokeromyces recurvatus]